MENLTSQYSEKKEYVMKSTSPKLAYCYDEETKEFSFIQETQLDKLESEIQDKDIFLLPANATFIEPKHQEGKVSVWNGAAWEYHENIVGRKYYDFDAHQIKEVKKNNEKHILFSKEQEELLEQNSDMTIELDNYVYKIYYTDEQLKNKAREKRDIYLKKYVDSYQEKPLLWNELSEEKKEKIAQYRKYLLDYPNTDENWFRKEPKTYKEYFNE